MLIKISSAKKRQVIDITEKVAETLRGSSGLVNVFVLHTTAAVTTADLDPGTDEDFLDFLEGIIPKRQWRHPHNPEHAPDHLLSSIIGPGVNVPVKNGHLQLGTWQRIILVELDGPRNRDIEIAFIKA
jgi:secondary thiamine-phosphate synthase enzyme